MERWVVAARAEQGAASPYWGSLLHGMLLERLSSEWQERLHGDGLRPFSQWVEAGAGGAFVWRLNVLDDDLAAAVEPHIFEGQRWHCKHLQSDLIFERVAREHLSIQAYMKPFFLAGTAAPRLRLTFCTTTTHRTQGGYALFSSVELIAGRCGIGFARWSRPSCCPTTRRWSSSSPARASSAIACNPAPSHWKRPASRAIPAMWT